MKQAVKRKSVGFGKYVPNFFKYRWGKPANQK